MQTVTIRGSDFDNIWEIHDYLSEELNFPSYYGKNLDALYDVLTEISEDTHIIMDFTDMLDDTLYDQMLKMSEVMSDAAEYNHYLDIECREEYPF